MRTGKQLVSCNWIYLSCIFGSVLFLPLQTLAANQTVSNTNDSGAGSLRQAIADVGSGEIIDFNLASGSTIVLSSSLGIAKNLTIQGPGAAYLTISGNNAYRVFNLTSGTITISGLTISNGRVNGSTETGAGFKLAGTANLTVDRCAIQNHTLLGGSNQGAAFYVPATGTLAIHRSTIQNNSIPSTNNGGEGGAIYSQGTLTVTSTLFYNNSGFLCAALCSRSASPITTLLANCTISGNVGDNGGVVANKYTGTLQLLNCTITLNQSTGAALGYSYEAGVYAEGGGTIQLRNNVIAGNLPGIPADGEYDVYFDTNGISIPGSPVTFVSQGYNLIGSQGSQSYAWSTGDTYGSGSTLVNANLAGLADNGGWIRMHLPNSGSPAINLGADNLILADGRGYTRVSTSDRGACEFGGVAPAASGATNLQPTSFTANWNAMTGASAYLLDVSLDPEFKTMLAGYRDLSVPATSAAVTGLTSGVTYYYRVRGYNGFYQTYYSNTVSALPLAFTPTSTATFTATLTATSTSTLTLTRTITPTGTPTPTATATHSSTATLSPTATPSPTASLTKTSSATSTLSPTASATLTASATPSVSPTLTRSPVAGATATPTPWLSATVSCTPTCSGTQTPNPTGSLTPTLSPIPSGAWTLGRVLLAYPNPGRQQMHIFVQSAGREPIQLHLYNMNGEAVANLTAESENGLAGVLWNCGEMAPGVYLVRATQAGKEIAKAKVAVIK